jgi:hypothetical protein
MLIPRTHIVQPGDFEQLQQITFSLAELKILQGIVTSRITQDSADDKPEYQSHDQLAKKLEYFITNLEEQQP